jgi:HTH-type transcriptional regulator/antitoxin HigA
MMEDQMATRRPAEVFHPGEYLRDELKERDWSQVEFAEIIGRDKRLVNEIINGKRGITPETARAIGAALGTSAEVWMNLDSAYNLWKSDTDVSKIELRAKMASIYPVRDMTLRSWIVDSEDAKVIYSQLLRFFEVASLDEPPRYARGAVARRSNYEDEDMNPIQIAWLYRVKHIAESMIVTNYSQQKLRKLIEQLKSFRESAEEIRHIPRLLEECGVRFVIVEPLPSSRIDGVCLWIGDSPIIGMTLRFDRIDNFWFVIRHEIEHIINGDGKDEAIVDSNLMETIDDESLSEQEKRANAAAAEFCTPQDQLENLIARKGEYISRKDFISFAMRLRIHPGIVAGQLRNKTGRWNLFNSMNAPIREHITPVSMTDGYGYFLPIEI